MSGVNSRVEELEFLISIMSDLSFKYEEHNKNILSELIAVLKYRRDNETKMTKDRFRGTHIRH